MDEKRRILNAPPLDAQTNDGNRLTPREREIRRVVYDLPPDMIAPGNDALTPRERELRRLGNWPLVGDALGDYARAVLADNPVGFWRLNEATGTLAMDVGSGANHGTYTAGYTLQQPGATSDSDRATALNGAGGTMVTIPDTFPTFAAAALSVDCWIQVTNPAVSQVLFGAMNPVAAFQGWAFGVGVLTPGILAYWSGTAAAWVESTVAITDSAWHHVGLSVPAGGPAAAFYLDGAATGTPASNSPNAYALSKAIGAHRTGVSPFGGVLDDLAVYPTALSPARFLAHFRAR